MIKYKNARLLLREVMVDEKRFQDRVLAGNGIRHRDTRKKQCEKHIEEMAATVRLTGEQLDPFFVWKDGGGWNLVNGFHRYYAYQAAQWRSDRKLECLVVEASSEEEALQVVFPDNIKTSLGMPTGERMEVCWRARIKQYQQSKRLSVRVMAKTYFVSRNSVSNIDKAIKRIITKDPNALNQWVGTWDFNRRKFEMFNEGDEVNVDASMDAASISRLAAGIAELMAQVPWDIAQKAFLKAAEFHNEQTDNEGVLVVAGHADWKQAKVMQNARSDDRRISKAALLAGVDPTDIIF